MAVKLYNGLWASQVITDHATLLKNVNTGPLLVRECQMQHSRGSLFMKMTTDIVMQN
jgi:hypothetical protein